MIDLVYDEHFVKMHKIVSEYSRLNSLAIFGYVPEIEWPFKINSTIKPIERSWMRVSRSTVIERQASLRAGGIQRYTTEGVLFVQLFLSREDAQSGPRGYLWANGLKAAFRRNSTDQDTIYRESRVEEAQTEAQWFRLNFVTEYEYDELQ